MGLTCPETAKWFLTALKMLDVFLGFSNSALLSASEVSSSNWSKRLSVSVASKTIKISKYYFLWYIFVSLDRYIVIFQTCENISQIPNPSQFYHHYYLKIKMLISFSYHAINHTPLVVTEVRTNSDFCVGCFAMIVVEFSRGLGVKNELRKRNDHWPGIVLHQLSWLLTYSITWRTMGYFIFVSFLSFSNKRWP